MALLCAAYLLVGLLLSMLVFRVLRPANDFKRSYRTSVPAVILLTTLWPCLALLIVLVFVHGYGERTDVDAKKENAEPGSRRFQ